jgi:secretion/DNA translocation related TadE-like protein
MRERGSVSILAVTGALIFSLAALALADVGSLLVARARAEEAADAAALAAVAAQADALDGGRDDPVEAARAYAERNGAELVRCECEEGRTDAVVEVAVVPRLTFLRGWLGRRARATARAELDPDVLSYRT